MKRVVVFMTATIVIAAATAVANSQHSTANRNQIMGTWQLVSGVYGGQPTPAGTTEVKIISTKRFMFIQYDPANNKALASGFGTYVFTDDSYTEHIELLDVNGQGDSYVGKDLTFTVKLDGDTMVQSGSIGQMSLKETWKRMD